MNADGSGQTRLTTNPAWDILPAWSPDGTKLAFTSWRDGNIEVYVMAADGSGRTRLTTDPGYDYDPAWQPLVLDTTPPVLTTPGVVAADATGPAGARVDYSVAASDDSDPAPILACAPPSGSTFAIGDTTVACTATDVSGNSSTATFAIQVLNATEQLLELQAVIEGYHLEHGRGSDLTRYLNAAVKYLARGETERARQQVDQFLATVGRGAAKIPPWLSSSQAAALTEAGHRIRAVLGG
jgi:hypothetical protein